MSRHHTPHLPRIAPAAYTLADFAGIFNKNRSWSYRLAAKGKIKTIHGYGCTLVPASEVTRILEGGSH
jgi:hypothetical protein